MTTLTTWSITFYFVWRFLSYHCNRHHTWPQLCWQYRHQELVWSLYCQNDHFDHFVNIFLFRVAHPSYHCNRHHTWPNCVGNIGTINWVDPCIAKMTTLTTLSITFYFVWRFRVIIAIDTIHDPNCVGNIGTINWFDPCIDKMTTLTTLSISLFRVALPSYHCNRHHTWPQLCWQYRHH
jgi:hypothetical protein